MAKKKSKQQPNHLLVNATSHGNTASESVTVTAITTNIQPAITPESQLEGDAYAPLAATSQHSVSFFDFITLATTEDIRRFLKLAGTTTESKNLENLWRRAYGEGYEKGRKSLLQGLEKKLEESFEKGVERGKDLGQEEGYTVAKEGFDAIVKALKARDTPKTSTSDSGMQTDPPPATISTQTYPISAFSVDYSTSSTQTNPLNDILHTTTDVFVQTNPISAQNSYHTSWSPTSVPATPACFLAIANTQTDTRTSQHAEIGSPTCVATSQLPELLENGKKYKNLHYKGSSKRNFARFRRFFFTSTI